MSEHPLSAARLYALMGEAMHELPPHFIERLERKLECFQSRCVGDLSPAQRRDSVPVPGRTLQGLDAILEILHAVHLGQQNGDREAVLSEHLVEGLIVSGRVLIKTCVDHTVSAP